MYNNMNNTGESCLQSIITPKIIANVSDMLHKQDGGELFCEYKKSEILTFDNHKVKNSSFNISGGFAVRTFSGLSTALIHSNNITENAVLDATNEIKKLQQHSTSVTQKHSSNVQHNLYKNCDPTNESEYIDKIELVQKIDNYIRTKNNSVQQVTISLSGDFQLVQIISADGRIQNDIRPLVRISIVVVVGSNGKMESGFSSGGGRGSYKEFIFHEEKWRSHADKALCSALTNLEAIPAPAGTMTVILGPGWPGILLHEAIGHPLEGDNNRKQNSPFCHLMGKQVASKGITVVDDGTIANRRGSLNIDDEGTPTQHNVLIEDGILVGYLQDKKNANLMDVQSTGSGRRESYAHVVIPRMTNTFMEPGKYEPKEIIESVQDGIYAKGFSGGQVDTTSGKFVFSACEAYLIKNGGLTFPIKGATLVGDGPAILKQVSMVGNDMQLDPGSGTCGKDGQNVPVGVGLPTIKIDQITVGGTE